MLDQLRYSIAYLFICYSIMFICKKLSRRGPLLQTGPLILCGTHFNCFLDGLFLINLSSRRISLLVSSNSYNQKVGGFYMRQVSSISINRPMDKRFKGKGQITISDTQVTGQETSFSSEVHIGDYIVIDGKEFRVIEVLNDFNLKIADSYKQNEWVSFNVYPKRDNTECLNTTINRLKEGHAVLLFPEGETHEQPAMLSIKGGIASIVINSISKGVNPNVQVFSYILSSPAKFRTKSELLLSEPFKFDENILTLEKSEAYKIVVDKITDELNKIRLPAETFEEIELAIFIAKLKKLKDFEMNKQEILRDMLLRINGLDGELFGQMRKIKDLAKKVGVSKYGWDVVSEFEYKRNLVIGAGLAVAFGVMIGVLLGISVGINYALKKYESEVLRKLSYRKNTIDCFSTWRMVFITLLAPFCGFCVFLYFLFDFGSISGAVLGTIIVAFYVVLAVFALDMINHSRKVITRFKIGDSEEIRQLNILKQAFLEDIRIKYSL